MVSSINGINQILININLYYNKELDMAKKGTLFGKPRGEVVKRPGAFSAKAKRSGMSTGMYAAKVTSKDSKASSRTKRQAGLAKAFATMRAKK